MDAGGEHDGRSTRGSDDADERADVAPERDDAAGLPTDDVFHILQSSRRRAVLHSLRDVDGPVEVGDLAERIAAIEHGTTVEALTSQQRQRVYISLYQTHLPKLDECGAIDYRKDRGLVVRQPAAAHLYPHLDMVAGGDESIWPRRYAAAVALCVGLLSASALGPVPLSGTAVASLVVVVVGVVTAAHSRASGWTPFLERPSSLERYHSR